MLKGNHASDAVLEGGAEWRECRARDDCRLERIEPCPDARDKYCAAIVPRIGSPVLVGLAPESIVAIEPDELKQTWITWRTLPFSRSWIGIVCFSFPFRETENGNLGFRSLNGMEWKGTN
jgi:hypothetical protein